MAVVVRYFSTSSAGAGDGTTWADRAALFSSGNWSSVITGFGFNGSDSLECRIGPGSYTCSQTLASSLFTNAPTAPNPLILHGCDSSGNRLAPPDPDWTSPQAPWDTSGLPFITITGANFNLSNLIIRLLKIEGTATFIAQSVHLIDWCSVKNNTSGTTAYCINGQNTLSNSVFACAGPSYDMVVRTGALTRVINCRVSGPTGTTGDRDGIEVFSAGVEVDRCTIIGVGGNGVESAQAARVSRTTIVGCGGTGLVGIDRVDGAYVANSGAYGANANSRQNYITNSRFRDNTSGNFTGFGNVPTDLDNYVTDAADADEFVDAANGDYRIKATSALWGKGYGAGDEIPSPAAIAAAVWARVGRTLTA